RETPTTYSLSLHDALPISWIWAKESSYQGSGTGGIDPMTSPRSPHTAVRIASRLIALYSPCRTRTSVNGSIWLLKVHTHFRIELDRKSTRLNSSHVSISYA